MSEYASWWKTAEIYDAEMKSFELNDITDFDTYIDALQDDNYSIYLQQMPWTCSDEVWEHIQEELEKLGFENVSDNDAYSSYAGIVSFSDPQENVASKEDEMQVEGRNAENGYYYAVSETGITINDVSYPGSYGIRIVVYDNLLERVVDSVRLQDDTLGLER
jgi:hypothetical protein